MTVVLAKRFDDSICILSDTMITEADLAKENGIPGRLKIVILDRHFTVAYAGHTNQALDTIREARAVHLHTGVEAALDHLRKATTSQHADFEFIVAIHRPQAELRRIWSGIISEGLEQTAIGDSRVREEVDRRFTTSKKQGIRDYHAAFLGAFTDKKTRLGSGVGGFPICVFAKPDAHAYRGHNFGHRWKPIVPVWGETTYEDENELLTGEWSFHHTVMTIDDPGIALLGVEVPQAKVGFVYSPLQDDEPVRVKLLGQEKMWTQHSRGLTSGLNGATCCPLWYCTG